MTRLTVSRVAAAFTLLTLAAGLTSCGQTEEDTSQAATDRPTNEPGTTSLSTSTPEPSLSPVPTATPIEGTAYRWANVVLIVPSSSDVSVGRWTTGFDPSRTAPVFRISAGESVIVIDSTVGEVYFKKILDPEVSLFDEIIASIRIEPKPSVDQLPWPYSSSSPNGEKLRLQNVLYWEPEPLSGLTATFMSADGVGWGANYILLINERSKRTVNADTGIVNPFNDQIAAEDMEAFDRWTQAVEYVGS